MSALVFLPPERLTPFLQDVFRGTSFRMKSLSGGLVNQNILVVSNQKKFVLKVYRSEMDGDRVKEMNRVMRFAKQNGIPVPEIIAETVCEDRSVALYEFLEGRPGRFYQNPLERIRSMGKMLGKIQNVLSEFRSKQKKPEPIEIANWDLAESLERLNKMRKQVRKMHLPEQKELEHAFNRFEQIWATGGVEKERFLALPMHLCHGDFHRSNLLFQGNHLTAVLDWEKFGWTWRIFEVMRTVMFNCKKRADALDWDLVAAYLKAYQSEIELTEKEKPLVFDAGYLKSVYSLWAVKEFLSGRKEMMSEIRRRVMLNTYLTKHRKEFGERIAKML